MRGFGPTDFPDYGEYQIHRDRLERAQRTNNRLFDAWNDSTGLFPKNTGYRYEIESLLEDAVQIGYEAALKIPHKPSDYDIDEATIATYPNKCDFCKNQYFVYNCEEECTRRRAGLPCKLEVKEYLD